MRFIGISNIAFCLFMAGCSKNLDHVQQDIRLNGVVTKEQDKSVAKTQTTPETEATSSEKSPRLNTPFNEQVPVTEATPNSNPPDHNKIPDKNPHGSKPTPKKQPQSIDASSNEQKKEPYAQPSPSRQDDITSNLTLLVHSPSTASSENEDGTNNQEIQKEDTMSKEADMPNTLTDRLRALLSRFDDNLEIKECIERHFDSNKNQYNYNCKDEVVGLLKKIIEDLEQLKNKQSSSNDASNRNNERNKITNATLGKTLPDSHNADEKNNNGSVRNRAAIYESKECMSPPRNTTAVDKECGNIVTQKKLKKENEIRITNIIKELEKFVSDPNIKM